MPTTINVGDATNAIITLTFAGKTLDAGDFSVKNCYPYTVRANATLELDCLPRACIMFNPA
jgi:hypothetical protein